MVVLILTAAFIGGVLWVAYVIQRAFVTWTADIFADRYARRLERDERHDDPNTTSHS